MSKSERILIIDDEKNALQQEYYKSQAIDMQARVAEMILTKQKATVAMALSLANDENLLGDMLSNNISDHYYKNLKIDFLYNRE